MIVRIVFALFCLLSSPAFAGTLYPADISPSPALALGTLKLRSTYAGNALTACKASCTLSASIGFVGDNLDTTTLDTFLAGGVGQVSAWNDQMGTGLGPQGSASESPSIQNLAIGSARTLVFQGGSQSGALFSMNTPDISSLAITANAWTMMAVIEPSSSAFCNQAGAPGLSSGALFNFTKAGGGSVAAVFNNSELGGPGAWEVTDQGAFDFNSPNYMVPVIPQVLTVTSGASGVRVYVNEQIRATLSRSALTDTVQQIYLGKLIGSIVGSTSNAWDGEIAAFMVWNSQLSESQTAVRRAALYDRFSIDRRATDFDSYNVTIVGDSIPAGYKTLGIVGYAQYLPALLNHPTTTRVINFSIPGSTVTQNPAGGPLYANNVGQFPTSVPPTLPLSLSGRVVVIHAGGNDQGIGATPRTGNTHSSTLIDNISVTTDLTVGDFVAVSGLNVVATIASKTANSITLTQPVGTTLAGTQLLFTNAATSPTAVATADQGLVTSSTAAGATGVVVAKILPRNVVYQPWLTALNVQLSSITGATVVDCTSTGNLATNPGPDYADASHLTAAGHQDMATCLAPAINALMP